MFLFLFFRVVIMLLENCGFRKDLYVCDYFLWFVLNLCLVERKKNLY